MFLDCLVILLDPGAMIWVNNKYFQVSVLRVQSIPLCLTGYHFELNQLDCLM